MNLVLTWDLFVIVFVAVVIAYSFIIGKHESVKIIISTYIAIVAGQGLGTFIATTNNPSSTLFNAFGLTLDITLLGGAKLLIFVATIIFIAVRGGLEIEYSKETSFVTNTILTALFGFATAGLLLSTLLTFVADSALLDANLMTNATLAPLVAQSQLMRIMIEFQGLWFALPAVLLIAVGIFSNE